MKGFLLHVLYNLYPISVSCYGQLYLITYHGKQVPIKLTIIDNKFHCLNGVINKLLWKNKDKND